MEDTKEIDTNLTGSESGVFMDQLKATFERLPNDIPIYQFTKRGEDNIFCQTNREIVRLFRQLTDKITFREYYLDHDLAQKWNVESSPTLLINPECYSIRWIGAPMGEEGRTFLETLTLVGLGKSNLSSPSIKVIRKINTPRKIKVFVSATCPYCPQQAVNAVKAAVEIPDLISLEIVDIQCRSDLADQYSAHSVPMTFADDVLIGQGAQTEEVFVSSLKNLEAQTIFIPESDAELVETDLLIVGGGPAGLTAGIYAVRSGLNSAVIERKALGGQVATTPVVENYPGFTQIGGKALVDIMVSHALQYIQIFQGEEVVDIQPGNPIEVLTTRRRFLTKSVLLTTGATYKHLGVPGESRLAGRGVSYCSTCDGPLFKGKKVVMVGGGNSAVTEALHLNHIGVSVTLIHRGGSLRAQDFLKKNLKESKIPVLWHTEIKEIRGDQRVEEILLFNNDTQKSSTLKIDGVFLAIGYLPAVDLAKKIGMELTADGYIKKDSKHRTNIPGIYSAGDVEGGYKQIVTAAGQGSEAAIAIFEDTIHPYWQQKEKVSL
ncbi:MAG: FAD-dependent oxidoreductase [Desulfobacterales bacterium]|jgi:thioredoxin reductase (NADPH)|nr:pyridine nucleotide-disulfide oxidoreductase [Desulfobacter sp.]MDP6395644.1 FAD-dependent oxidoreductase [Desulfobacterales bacterium]MDP6681798.1 FAD-dependent oxidoreductase [Desulfobacterales bacterium]MDP6807991.1 FAD-dependent oxidoreductase [Desulfobacterales bacterium]|tara:strand:- start:9523 stop:11163 length:1641 start_codon:yes stop_codon:yes gene_type:complete